MSENNQDQYTKIPQQGEGQIPVYDPNIQTPQVINQQGQIPVYAIPPQPQTIQVLNQPISLPAINISPINPQIQITSSNNQITNSVIFRSTPQQVTCIHCGYTGLTNTITSFNIANFICCWVTDPICWLCFQLCRGKDISCNDATHYCRRCNHIVGNYTAC